MPAFGDDDVGVAFAGLDELEVHGLHCVAIVLEGCIHVASALEYVSVDYAHKAVIGLGIYEYLDVHQFAQLCYGEDEYTFDDDDVGGFDFYCVFFAAGAGDVGIYWLLYGLACFEVAELLAEEIPVQCIGMVEIDVLSLFNGDVAAVFVVGVLGYHCNLLVEAVLYGLHDRCLS